MIDEDQYAMYAGGCASFLQFYNARTSSCGKSSRDAEADQVSTKKSDTEICESRANNILRYFSKT